MMIIIITIIVIVSIVIVMVLVTVITIIVIVIIIVIIRPISLVTSSLLRLLDSSFPGDSLWAWKFRPLKLSLCLSQTL